MHKKAYKKNSSHTYVSDESIAKGEVLAGKFCESCHLLPDPSLLDAGSWLNGVLPRMGPRLGIFGHFYRKYPDNRTDKNIGRDFYPEQPLLSQEEWQHIIDYYTSLSPDTLRDQSGKQLPENNLSLFKEELPDRRYYSPATCMVKVDNVRKQLYISDVLRQSVYRFNNKLEFLDSVNTGGAVVDLIFHPKRITACNIGVISPVNGKFGTIQQLYINDQDKIGKDAAPAVSQLMRPVQLAEGDLNQDGKTDLVVCEFGYMKGALSWMENTGNGHFIRHVLRAIPGAIKACIDDCNGDGLPDIWVLFAQGEEGIFLYTNRGNGNFEERQLLRFPPCYGSTYFQLADFNGDGHQDIMYTCGDNGDYSTVLKPYHGVYLFMNDGRNDFSREYFYPVNGCYKAIAADFDGDGDLDIAAIAFFADYKNNPDEGFMYFENMGGGKFKPSTLSGTRVGRWMTMEAADLDGDGRMDLILGNCSVGPTLMHSTIDWKKGPPFMLLKNTGNKN